MSRLNAPWSPGEQEHIAAWQKKPDVHPFTCDQGHHVPLIVATFELTCPHPGCIYKQTWVHDFMAGY